MFQGLPSVVKCIIPFFFFKTLARRIDLWILPMDGGKHAKIDSQEMSVHMPLTDDISSACGYTLSIFTIIAVTVTVNTHLVTLRACCTWATNYTLWSSITSLTTFSLGSCGTNRSLWTTQRKELLLLNSLSSICCGLCTDFRKSSATSTWTTSWNSYKWPQHVCFDIRSAVTEKINMATLFL